MLHRELEFEKGRLTRAFDRCQNELKEANRERLEDSQSSVDLSQQKITDMTKQIQTRDSDISRLRQEMRAVDEARMKAEADLKFVKAQSDTFQKAVEDLNAKLEAAKSHNQSLTLELQQSKRETESVKNQLREVGKSGSDSAVFEQQARDSDLRHKREIENLRKTPSRGGNKARAK